MKTIGIVGSRRRHSQRDSDALVRAFNEIYSYDDGDRIVSGGCERGADAYAESLARIKGITIVIHHADWNGPLGKAAGLSRNTLIAMDCDILIALPAPDRTGGTEDAIKKALNLGKKVILV